MNQPDTTPQDKKAISKAANVRGKWRSPHWEDVLEFAQAEADYWAAVIKLAKMEVTKGSEHDAKPD